MDNKWSIPDKDGIIHVPDKLDPLINNIAMQIRLHRISGKGEIQTVCDIVYICEQFFSKDLK